MSSYPVFPADLQNLISYSITDDDNVFVYYS